MENLLSIIQNAVETQKGTAKLLLNALEEHQSYHTSSDNAIDATISKINGYLQNQTTRAVGFKTLTEFIPNCSATVLDERGFTWLNAAIKICTQRNPADAIPAAYNAIKELIKASLHAPELSKQITHNVLQKIIESCWQVPDFALLPSLKCLIECMHRYPGPCGPSKNIVEKLAISHVDSDNDEVVHYVSAVLLLLQQIRSGGEHGRQHKRYWSEYCDQLIGSTHHLLNVLFVNYEEMYDADEKEREKLKLPDLALTDQPISRNVQATQRLLNILKCLRMAIIGPYPVAKLIKIEALLELINRAIVVNSKMIAKNAILDNLIVAALIPQIHIEFLELLNSLIITLKLNLRDYCTEINKILHTSLQWTSSGVSQGQKKPFTNLRIATYQSLRLWVEVMGRNSLVEKFGETIVSAVIEDSTPYRSEITLQVNMGSTKNLSKRAKKKLIKERNEATNLAQSHSSGAQATKTANNVLTDENNRELCYAALSALYAVFDFVGTWIEPELHLALQQHLIRLGVHVSDSQLDHRHLYYSAQCRGALYNILASICTSCHGLTPPPLQYVTNILARARSSDESAQVRDICARRLGELELILQPIRESIFPEIDSEMVTEVVRNAKKRAIDSQPDSNEMSDDDENEVIVLVEDEDDMIVDKPLTPPPQLIPINGNASSKPLNDNNPSNNGTEKPWTPSGFTRITFSKVPGSDTGTKKFLMETSDGRSSIVTQSVNHDEDNCSDDSTEMVRGSESEASDEESSDSDNISEFEDEINELNSNRDDNLDEDLYRNLATATETQRKIDEVKIQKVVKAVEATQLMDKQTITDEDKLVEEMVEDFVAD